MTKPTSYYGAHVSDMTREEVSVLQSLYGDLYKPKLFVYGIFLAEHNRKSYGMENPRYDTVLNYATFGSGIVQAVHIPDLGLSLTGLIVDPDESKWDSLDLLESGYDRVLIKTTSGVEAYMYVQPSKETE